MGKNRIIFYSIFGAYQLIAFIFTIAIDSHDMSTLLSLAGYLPWFKYISFFGLILIAIDFAWSWRQQSKTKEEVEEFRHENNILKAKIYDIQEIRKALVDRPDKPEFIETLPKRGYRFIAPVERNATPLITVNLCFFNSRTNLGMSRGLVISTFLLPQQ